MQATSAERMSNGSLRCATSSCGGSPGGRRGVRRASAGLLAVVAVPLALAFAPTAAAAEAGCPLTWSEPPQFWQLPAGIDDPDYDEAGPFGGTQQRLRSVSFSVEDGSTLAVGVRVENMRRTVRAGFRWGFWEVTFTTEGRENDQRDRVEVYYDVLLDEFRAYARVSGWPVEGSLEVFPGPNGGWLARFPLATYRAERGLHLLDVRVSAGDFVSYTYMNSNPADPRTAPTGIYAYRWRMAGPPSVPLIGCPDVALRPVDLGNGRGIALQGDALPAGSAITLDIRDGATWREVAQANSDATGAFTAEVPIAPGVHEFRARATSPDGTVSISDPAAVEATD